MEKQTTKQKIDSFCTFLYNSETGQLLGRGGRSWAEIGFFYLIYYICLSAFFAATIAVFYQTIDENKPKLQADSSLLKGNPGLGYKPMPDIETTLIHVAPDNAEAAKDSIDEILNAYNESLQADNVKCNPGDDPKVRGDKACSVDVAAMRSFCNPDTHYGYGGPNPKPCVLLKLNKIFGWTPEIADEKPENLVIANENEQYSTNRIWISCDGENKADQDNLGKVSYFPQQGFGTQYYPYKKQKNYLAPLVMVRFDNPIREMGLMVKCIAYANNIKVDPTEKQGSVQFELLVDA